MHTSMAGNLHTDCLLHYVTVVTQGSSFFGGVSSFLMLGCHIHFFLSPLDCVCHIQSGLTTECLCLYKTLFLIFLDLDYYFLYLIFINIWPWDLSPFGSHFLDPCCHLPVKVYRGTFCTFHYWVTLTAHIIVSLLPLSHSFKDMGSVFLRTTRQKMDVRDSHTKIQW